ncbi:prephenate dehydrogenase [uncultured Faecalicoccus sp.]|uniref:prephenate dehydrogenase n=1 Tax=uncultured Faecalicoccus sp. TaxID=1971760 RepID=UPI002626A145|nr:prephenate dehydrogenase [uncultured Faecalicoccus sp.]
MKTIGIVGLGVMGASFAKRLSQKGYAVYGFEVSQKVLDLALAKQIITKGTTEPRELLWECDEIILALYPTQILPWVKENQKYFRPQTLLMDISGVKSNIILPVQEILRNDVELISIHPMCGRESRGIEFSDETIFDGANYIVVPTSRNSKEAIQTARELGSVLGVKRINELSIEEHDRMIGFLSQLTHVIAVSLMNTHENSHLVEYTGDSFRDLTRIASINEDLWSELFVLNKDILLEEIDQFMEAVSHFKTALKQEDTEEMKRLFIQSTQRRERFNQ